MKRISSLLLAILWPLCCIIPVFAADPAPSNIPEGELTFETITLGDKTMEIPVFVKTVEQPSLSRSGGSGTKMEETATYCIPMTDEGIEYNEAYVQAARSARLSDITQGFDFKHYFVLQSKIEFTLYDSLDGEFKDSLLGMDTVTITRSQDPAGLDLDILGAQNPCVVIKQFGTTDRGHGIIMGNGTLTYDQEITYDNDKLVMHWGEAVDVPTEWFPVIIQNYGTSGYTCSATYTFVFYYSDGIEPCGFTHYVVR